MALSMCRKMAVVFNMETTFVRFFAVLSLVIVVDAAQLSDPKILLPYHLSVITNYTLNINLTKEESRAQSCYTWRSSRLDVATVRLLNSTDNECAFSAEISAMSKSSMRKTSIVIAENKVTGEVLKCIVIVDTLHRIEIETTTRLLYLEDTPEELNVRGYDAEGNVFSSLRGLEFQWSLHSDKDVDTVVDANSILRILKFSESVYTTPRHIDVLEGRGRQGDIILVEGIRTGSASVWAKVREEAYANVPHSSVRLMVIANLMVSPSEAYVLKYATVKYKVEQIRQSSIIAIKMPSAQFYLEVQEKMICTLDARTSVATAQELGETEIKLIDKNIQMSDMLGQPSAILHVVSPSYLAFVVLPDRKWVLETGREYEVLIEVYDKNSHKIYPSDNVIINALFPSEYFQVMHSSKNGTYHHVQTLRRGDEEIEGSLSSIIRDDGTEFAITPSLKQMQHFEIYDPITVSPSVLFFPWDPVKEMSHQYPLMASGGSGEYVWSSDNGMIATVNKRGEITTFSQGDAIVTAADKRNQLHTGSALVHVLVPSDMEFQPSKVEMVVGSVLELPLDVHTAFKGRQYSFHDCRNMPLNITFSDPSVFKQEDGYSPLVEGSCRTVKVKAVQQGHTKVIATYNHGGVNLKSSLTIAAYDPLLPIDPEKEAVVAVGSSKEVIFAGGPQPWVLDSSKFFQTLASEGSSTVGINQVQSFGSQGRLHSFYVTCKDFGELMLILKVGNEKTAKNKNPAVEEASVKFVCAEPVELHVVPQVVYPRDLPPCPVARELNQPVPAHCQQELPLVVQVTDSHGRRFDNVSSLEFDWQLSDRSLATLSDTGELESIVDVLANGQKKVTNVQTLEPQGRPGNLVVTATITQYRKKYLMMAKSYISEYISQRISKSVELRLVEEAVVSPGQLSVFNHPSNKVKVDIQHGSGFFHVVEEKTGIVQLKYVEKKKQLEVLPLTDGSLMVKVYDLCIDTRQPATTAVSVSGVGSVQLYVMDKVEVGKEIVARVQVLDVAGRRLYASFFPLMGLRLEPAADLIMVKQDGKEPADNYTATYIIHGAFVGHTSLKAVTYLPSGRTIASQAKPVEVFPPLELIPRNITLIIGDLFQVLSRGGPRPQCTVVFTIRNSKIATVSSSGLLDPQSLGTTRVVGQAVGQDPETGETVIYSQDEVTVNVIRLAGIRIHAPLTRLQTGTTMPMFAVGMTEHETPFTFGSAFPALAFKWSVNKKDVAKLQSVFYKSNIQPQQEGNFAMQMVAMETGHVSVRLEVKVDRGYNQVVSDSVLTDELQIQVFTKLAMVSPSVCDDVVLMTPNTEAPLRTNRDGSAKVSYEIMSTDDTSAVVTVTEDGMLQTGSSGGQAALLITAQEEFGTNQTVLLLVKVKPVSYLMVNSDITLRTSGGQLTTVPRGTTLQFSVTYHDDVGEQFYATNVQMKYRCNRYDLVQASHGLGNNSLVVKTAAIGQTILKVWDEAKPWLVDYISIPVGDAVGPSQGHVLLGSVVCFQSPILSVQGYTGSWTGNKYLEVDHETGIATATAVGTTAVTYFVSSDISTETEIFVEAIREVTVDTSQQFITTAVGPDHVYYFFLSFGGGDVVIGKNCGSKIAEAGYIPSRIPFLCDLSLASSVQGVSVSDLFAVSAVFLPKIGRYACQVVPRQSGPLQQISVVGTNLQLGVTVMALKDQPEVQAPTKTLQFLPPIYVHNSEIHVSTLTPLSSLRISTIAELAGEIEVVSSDTSILEVLASEKDAQSKSVILYPIRLLDTLTLWEREHLDVSVDLICQKIGQRVKIPVYIRLLGQRPDLSSVRYGSQSSGWRALFSNILHNYQYWFILLVIIIITAVTVIVGYHTVYGSRYRPVANTVGFMAPPGPSTPIQQQQPSPVAGYSPPPYDGYYPQTPRSPQLWSTGYTPLGGSPATKRRTPIQRISPP